MNKVAIVLFTLFTKFIQSLKYQKFAQSSCNCNEKGIRTDEFKKIIAMILIPEE